MSAVEQRPRGETSAMLAYDRDAWRRVFAEIAGGRPEALACLYDLAAESVFALAAWRLGSTGEAADVVQDVFVRVAERADGLASIDDPRAWLFTVAHRVAVDHGRRRSRHATDSLDEHPFLETDATEPARRFEARIAQAALAQLPERQRVVIYLHHFAGCTFEEIGRIARVPTFTAASRYRLGMKKLRTLLEASR
jgi:RNA polymerase sigma-70 factor (ECF subfamily)